ncbi:MAG: amino acid permease [Chitinophagaceae bacterium]
MQENLKRDIGTFGLACTVVNIMIGTGIFVLPALAAEKLGAAAIICFFICGFLIFLIALCFAEIGSKVTVSGGAYTYIETAFGPFTGFLANNIFWFGSCMLGDAGIANALSKTLSHFFPVLDTTIGRPAFLFGLFSFLAFVNVRGAKYGVWFSILTTIIKLVPLLLLVVFGLGHITAANLEWKQALTLNEIGSATLILFYTFVGIETSVNNGGEFKNPARTVPVGIFSGLVFVLLLYVSIQLVSQGILGDQLVADKIKDAPLAAVANRLFGTAGITLMIAGTAFAMLGTLSGEVLGNPRILFAGARDGLMPKALAKVHKKFATPYVSIAVYAALCFIFSVIGEIKQLLILSSATTLLIYLGVVLATIRMRYKQTTLGDQKTFKIPGGVIIPFLAIIIILWILSNLSRQEITGIIVFCAIVSALYLPIYFLKRKNNHQGNR